MKYQLYQEIIIRGLERQMSEAICSVRGLGWFRCQYFQLYWYKAYAAIILHAFALYTHGINWAGPRVSAVRIDDSTCMRRTQIGCHDGFEWMVSHCDGISCQKL